MLNADRAAVPVRSVVHHVYGINLRTPWPIHGAPEAPEDRWDIEFVLGSCATFADAAARVPQSQATWWAQHVALSDGSAYRRWRDLFEFLVAPDARRIYARTLNGTHDEALLAYLLVDALSYSMVHLGREPLHATSVVTGRGTVAVLGPSGSGKSTLAALLLRRGSKLLTDDMLVLNLDGKACLAQPGPPRIKLYRKIADSIFDAASTGIPMNAVTEKLIIALGSDRVITTAQPLSAIYVIETTETNTPRLPVIRPLTPAEALPRVLAATAGHYPTDRDRLGRQFEFVTRLLQRVPVHLLSYFRDPDDLFPVCDAVLGHVGRWP